MRRRAWRGFRFASLVGMLVLAALAAATAAGSQVQPTATVAYVAGSAPPPKPDRAIVERLEADGHVVVPVDDADMGELASWSELDLVIVSTSIDPTTFDDDLVGLPVPIITWDTATVDDLLMADSAFEAPAQQAKRWIDVVLPDHPIADGAQGRTYVFSTPATTSAATPATSAEIVAVDRSGAPTIFTYRAADLLTDGSPAAGCRTFAFLTWSSMDDLSAVGTDLLSAIVDDALGCEPVEVVDVDGDGYSPPDDCDDTDPGINPSAEDIPDDGIDQDCSGSDRRTPAGGPVDNVVVIMTDDMAYDDYAHMPKTQLLLGDEGVTFDRFFQNTPVCCPARATLLTGQRSLHHDVNSNKPADGEGYQALDHTNTLATWFEADGYDTIHVGKYLNGYGHYSLYPGIKDNLEIPPGWTNFQTLIGNVKYYDYTINDNGVAVDYGDAPEDYQTDVLADRAAAAIEESVAADNPFFLWVTTFAPHTWGQGFPPLPATRHETLYDDVAPPRDPSFNEQAVGDKPSYVRKAPKLNANAIRDLDEHWENQIESLQAVDDLVETVYQTLDAQDILDETLIVFLSDNGYLLGQHRLTGKVRPYEESIHVPLVMRGGPFVGGEHVDHVVSSTDLAPTITALTDVTPERVMDGLDLSDVLIEPARYDNRAIIIESVEGPGYDAVRTEDWMWIEYYGSGRELYDMEADPFQLDSKHKSGGVYADVRAELGDLLDELRQCVGADCIRYANP